MRTGDPLDTDQDIAGGAAARACIDAVIVDRDRLRTGRIVGRVVAAAAVDRVAARAANDRIVARTAQQRVAARAAVEQIVARAALDRIGVARAGDGIGEARTDDAFDRAQRIALCIARGARACGKIEHNSPGRGGIVCRIEAVAAYQLVRPDATDQHIIAALSAQGIGSGAAIKGIVKSRADQDFDACEHISGSIAAGPSRAVEPCGKAGGRCRIVCRIAAQPAIDLIGIRAAFDQVVAFSAAQDVCACRTAQDVIARACLDRIGIVAANDRIGKARTNRPLDIEQHVAKRLAPGA